MDRGAWWVTVHGVAKSRTRLSDFHFTHWKMRGRVEWSLKHFSNLETLFQCCLLVPGPSITSDSPTLPDTYGWSGRGGGELLAVNHWPWAVSCTLLVLDPITPWLWQPWWQQEAISVTLRCLSALLTHTVTAARGKCHICTSQGDKHCSDLLCVRFWKQPGRLPAEGDAAGGEQCNM